MRTETVFYFSTRAPTTGILLKGHGVLWAAGSIYYQTLKACTHVTMVCPSGETTCTAVTPWAAAGNMAENSTGMAGNSACHIGRKVTTMTQGAIIENIPLGDIHGGSPKMIHVESINKEVEFFFLMVDGCCVDYITDTNERARTQAKAEMLLPVLILYVLYKAK